MVLMWASPGDSVVKNLPVNAGDAGLILSHGRAPGEENGSPLQYLTWESPWTEKQAGYHHRRVGHNLVTKQQHHGIGREIETQINRRE